MTNFVEQDLANTKHMVAQISRGDSLESILKTLETYEKLQQLGIDTYMKRVNDLQEIRRRFDRIEQRIALSAKLEVLLQKDSYNNLDHIEQVCLDYKAVCYQSLTPPDLALAETKITRLAMLNRRRDIGNITDDEAIERTKLAKALGFDSQQ